MGVSLIYLEFYFRYQSLHYGAQLNTIKSNKTRLSMTDIFLVNKIHIESGQNKRRNHSEAGDALPFYRVRLGQLVEHLTDIGVWDRIHNTGSLTVHYVPYSRERTVDP